MQSDLGAARRIPLNGLSIQWLRVRVPSASLQKALTGNDLRKWLPVFLCGHIAQPSTNLAQTLASGAEPDDGKRVCSQCGRVKLEKKQRQTAADSLVLETGLIPREPENTRLYAIRFYPLRHRRVYASLS